MLSLTCFAALSMPAIAQDCWQNVEASPYGTSGHNFNGDVYVGGGRYGSSGGCDNFDVPAGNIIWAKAYWHGWMPPENVTARFCNANGDCYENTVDRCQNSDYEGFLHGGCGSAWMWWNVTDIVTNGHNSLCVLNGVDSRWQVLVVVLQNDSYPEINYSVNQGYLDDQYYTTHFYGAADNTRNGTVWQLAFTWNGPGNIWFNYGTPLQYLLDDTPEGGYGILEEYDVPPENTYAADNTMRWDIYGDEYVHPCLAVYRDIRPSKDLVVSDISGTPRPDHDSTINATIENTGTESTGAFNVSLYIDGNPIPEDTVRVTEDLSAGESTTVSFNTVNEPYGCHEFRVFADSANEIDESEEGNNNRTEDLQVGYVIVVKSNGDFATLLGDPGLPPGSVTFDGTTYYIQNLDIENCASDPADSDGILIEDTTTPFVVNNCTIHDCGSTDWTGNGVNLIHVTNGKVNGSEMNNVWAGIQVIGKIGAGPSTHVDITNNTVTNSKTDGVSIGTVVGKSYDVDPELINVSCNTLAISTLYYGIELIGSNCEVKGNLVQNTAGYGIYVYGNDSVIYNNTIENSGNYGIKLYNSSGNYVYWNDLTNNNGGAVQANDTWRHHPDWAFNHWNTSTQVSYCYNGGTYTNYTGNYWNDWTAPDSNGDGIVDTPYGIDPTGAAKDYYPLVVPWRLCGDVNRDGSVNFGDMGKVRRHKLFGESLCNPWAADVNCDGSVNFGDMGKIRRNRVFGELLNCCKDC